MTVTPIPAIRVLGLRPRLLVGLAIAAGVLIVVAANVHLVYVAVNSQPDCVAHSVDKGAAGSTALRAAESACSPHP